MTDDRRIGRIVPADAAPAETIRLLDEFAAAVPSSLPFAASWVRGIERARSSVREGHLDGAIWVGPKDEGIAVVTWPLPARAGRAVSLYLVREYQRAAPLRSLITALDAAEPVRVVHGPILGVEDGAVSAALAPLGLGAVVRQDMVLPASVSPAPVALPSPAKVREIRADDGPGFARLMQRGYAAVPIDRWLFAEDPDPQRDGEAAARFLLSDRLGRWRADASFGVEVDGTLVAATLVHELDGPLLSEVVVDPDWRGRGFARCLLARSANAARSLQLGNPRLVVTVGNDPADHLYRSIGFAPTSVAGTLWLRAPWPGSR